MSDKLNTSVLINAINAFDELTEDITDVHAKPWLKTALISHISKWIGESYDDVPARAHATAVVNLLIPDEHRPRYWVLMRDKRDEITDWPLFWNGQSATWWSLRESTVYEHSQTADVPMPRDAWGWVELPNLPSTN